MELDPGFTTQGFFAHILVEVIAALVATLGALLVAWLIYWRTRTDQLASFEKEARRATEARDSEEQRQHAAIRTALHREVTENLKRLEPFWSRIVLPGNEKNSPEEVARRLAGTAVPTWNTGIWQGAAAIVAVALPQENLTDLYRLYTTLAEISETQRSLQVARDADAAAYAAQPDTFAGFGAFGPSKIQTSDYFGNSANGLIPDLSAGVEAVRDRGNSVPLQ